MLGIIINPKSGKRAFRKQRLYLFRLLKRRHQPFHYVVTKYAGHATELARELVEKGFDQLLVLGGDGTISEVINGIMTAKVEENIRKNVQFGLMPRGTGNDWGRFWHLTRDYKQSLDFFFNGKPQPIDIGDLKFYRNGEEYHHYFVNSVGFGIDARTVERAHELKYYIGSHHVNYLFALLVAVFTHRSLPIEITTDKGESWKLPMFTMNIGNGPYSGGGIRQNPDADPRDGIFHSMFMPRPTWQMIWKALPNLFNGKLDEMPFIRNFEASQITMKTDKYVMFEADGILVDACGPYTITNLHHAIQMTIPADFEM